MSIAKDGILPVLATLVGLAVVRRIPSLLSLLVWPGTVLHELAHWVIGYVLAGRPTRLRVLPRREGTTWIFGSVVCLRITQWNAFPIAIAPVLVAWPAMLLYQYGGEGLGDERVFAYIATGVLLFSAMPSRTDLWIAISRPWGTGLYLTAIACLARSYLL